jgi:hypothetical protein
MTETETEIRNEIGVALAPTALMLNVMRVKNVLKTRTTGASVCYGIANDEIADACSATQHALSGIIGKRPVARSGREGG